MVSTYLTPYVCMHTFLYWINHMWGYSSLWSSWIRWPSPEARDALMYRMQDLIVDTGMHTILLIHSLIAMNYAFDAAALLNNSVIPSQLIVSQYALEMVYYSLDLLKLIITPSSHMKSDYIFHHTVSLALLLGSYISNYMHIGLLITVLLNSTNLLYDFYSYNHITRNLPGKWVSNGLFWSLFAYLRLGKMYDMVIEPVVSQTFNSYYSFQERVFFIPTVLALYGLQLYWFYKLTRVLLHNTYLLCCHPDVLIYIPNSVLYLIDPQLIVFRRGLLESHLEPPPMSKEVEELMEKISRWENILKETLIQNHTSDDENSDILTDTTTSDTTNTSETKEVEKEEPKDTKTTISEIVPCNEENETIDSVHEDIDNITKKNPDFSTTMADILLSGLSELKGLSDLRNRVQESVDKKDQ